jgi:tRNA pseudouridine-54 N-methylase
MGGRRLSFMSNLVLFKNIKKAAFFTKSLQFNISFNIVEMSQRKSPRSATIITRVISDDIRKRKGLRKEISKAIDASVKTEDQGNKWL